MVEQVEISKKERMIIENDNTTPIIEQPILKGYTVLLQKEIYFIKKDDSDVRLTFVKTKDNQELIIKRITYAEKDQNLSQELNREYYVGKMFGSILGRSPRLLRCLKEGSDECHFHYFEILMEHRGHPLNKVRLSTEQLHKVFYQLLQLLSEMEKLGIAHFDLKPANILWNEKTQEISLIDFGCALMFYEEKQKIYEPLMENAYLIRHCTPIYAPPEVMKSKLTQIIPVKYDVFSFGITMAELLISHKGIIFPKKQENTKDGINKYSKQIWSLLIDQHEYLEILKKCIVYDSKQRSTFSDLYIEFCSIFKIKPTFAKKSPEEYIELAKEYLNKGDIDIGQYFTDLVLEMIPDSIEDLEIKIMLEIQFVNTCLDKKLKFGLDKYLTQIYSAPENKLSFFTMLKMKMLSENIALIDGTIDETIKKCFDLMNFMGLRINSNYLPYNFLPLPTKKEIIFFFI